MLQFHSFHAFFTFPKLKPVRTQPNFSSSSLWQMDNQAKLRRFLIDDSLPSTRTMLAHKHCISKMMDILWCYLRTGYLYCLHASLYTVPSTESATHQFGKLEQRAWLTLPIQAPQTRQAGATWLYENKPCSSTNLHINPDISKLVTASAHELSKDLNYVLIHIFGQSGVKVSIILAITPEAEKQSNKCSRLQFEEQLLSPWAQWHSHIFTPYFLTFFLFQT